MPRAKKQNASPLIELDLIAQQLNRAKTKNTGGKPGFTGLAYDDAVGVLPFLVALGDDLTHADRHSIISKACFDCAQLEKIDGATLAAAIEKRRVEVLKLEPKRYVVATAISVQVDRIDLHRTTGESTIVIANRLPNWVQQERARRNLEFQKLTGNPTEYARVLVTTSGRSAQSAFERGLYDLDCLRGIWNLILNSKTDGRLAIGRLPVNGIRRGRFHTLHLSDGSELSEVFWYEPEWQWHQPPKRVSEREAASLFKAETRVRNQLEACPYAPRVTEMIVRYSRALDGRDYGGALVSLWGALEFATSETDSSNQALIKRAAFLWKDPAYGTVILSGIRKLRNDAVHSTGLDAVGERHLYSLKRYVEQLIWFHLQKGRTFASFGEACEFLDLPPDVAILRRQIRHRSRAVRWRKP